MERLTELDELGTPHLKPGAEFMVVKDKKGYLKDVYGNHVNKLCKFENLTEKLGCSFETLFEKENFKSCFMEISKDKQKMNFCGDAYYGEYSKSDVLNLIQELIGVYLQMEANKQFIRKEK